MLVKSEIKRIKLVKGRKKIKEGWQGLYVMWFHCWIVLQIIICRASSELSLSQKRQQIRMGSSEFFHNAASERIPSLANQFVKIICFTVNYSSSHFIGLRRWLWMHIVNWVSPVTTNPLQLTNQPEHHIQLLLKSVNFIPNTFENRISLLSTKTEQKARSIWYFGMNWTI